ncbi:MAG: PepSY-associated TM helix domain-containing protein [Planctomycetota bacterium]
MSAAALWNRKLHRWGAILTALPVLIVIVSGLFLLLKKDVDWIQPSSATSSGGEPGISFEDILASASSAEGAGIRSWDDVDRLDVRPSKGLVKVRGKSRWEVQIDIATGDVLQVAYRRSDLIESIHDGSFFHDSVKLWIFLPSALILFGLWVTGIYLWLLPHLVKRRRKRRAAKVAAAG